VKILLDENLPRKLVAALRREGQEADSVHTLRMQGLDNGRLYQFAMQNFDLCFTRDSGFTHNARQGPPPARLKLLRVTLPQKPQDEFVTAFILAFQNSDWERFHHGDEWP
jgi:predicted nuclease of predicted toxin-antitoxin system